MDIRVGDTSMSWSAATGGSRCSEVACETRLCRSWPGIAGSPFLDGWVFSRCSSSALGSVQCPRRVGGGGGRRLPERRFPPKRKNGIGSSSPGPVRRAELVGCVPVTIAGYYCLRKTNNTYIVLSEFPHCHCLHTDVLEDADVPV